LKTHKKNKIWIDFENSPHILFFNPIIKELEKRHHKVVLTARNYAQVFSLADLLELKYKKIGIHFGKNKFMKIIGLLTRVTQLIPFILKEKPSLAIGHGSRSLLLAATLTGVPTIKLSDYEFGQPLPWIQPTLSMVPEVMPDKSAASVGKIFLKYPGIKEDVYVHSLSPDSNELLLFGNLGDNVIVTIRPPATLAHYHTQKSDKLFEATINHICKQDNTKCIIVPRTLDQSRQIQNKWNEYIQEKKIIIPSKIVNGLNLIWHSDLVISAGGTMIREAAALDIPSYSIFGGELGAVDRYLAKTKRLILLDSFVDIQSKLVLEKRRPSDRMRIQQRPALNFIVDQIEKMLCEQMPQKAI
jgi:hypothetical protein